MSLPAGASDVRRIGGGDINEAFHVVLADGSEAFVKTRADVCPGEYAAEAAGLAWLAEPGALRTPRVLDVDDGYLALEWIAPGRLDAAGAEELGRGLAATHAAGAPRFGGSVGPIERPVTVRLAAAVQRPDRRLALVLRRAAPAPAGADRARARRAVGVRNPGSRAGVRAHR